jgi:hypothetical protein
VSDVEGRPEEGEEQDPVEEQREADPDAPGLGVVDPDDPDPPEPNEPA